MTLIFRGLPACPCLVAWTPAFESELVDRELVKVSVDIAQLIGKADASALVHSTGGAIDIWQTDIGISQVARQMGCVMEPRVTGSFANNRHSHGVLIGCPHLHQQGLDQIAEAYAGGDGLVGSVPDDPALHPFLYPRRTWQEGIVWHKEQAKARRRAALTAKILDVVTQRKQLAARLARLRAKRDAL